MDIKYFYISVMAVFVIPVRAFQGDMFLTGDTEIGGNITVTCSWTLSQNEVLLNVMLRSIPVAPNVPNDYYYQFVPGVSWASPGNQSNNRMSYQSFNSDSNRAIVTITNVQCSDGQNYSCYFTIGRHGLLNAYYEQTSYLEVKARPKAPSISLTPNTSTQILEFSNISAVCASNVGRPGGGRLQWKIYRSGVVEVIRPTDSRLDELTNVTLQPGDDSCAQRVEQTFRMRVSRSDQNLTFACFVEHEDFQKQTSDVCRSPVTDLCAQTQSLKIVVPALAFQSDMSITGDTEIGGNITITCSWTLSQNEVLLNVMLRSIPVAPGVVNDFYYHFNQGVSLASPGSQSNNRMSYQNFNSNSNRAIVRITNVQCSDGQNYSCYFTIGQLGLLNAYYEQTSYLEVKARPKAPSISLTPNTSTQILEFSNISAVCASNVGRPGGDSLQWKIYRSGVLEVIRPTDPRLDELKHVTLQPGDDSCTQRVEQTFRMRVSRSDQNLTIACFVEHEDFQKQTPDVCRSPDTDLCAQTQSLKIVYGVNAADMHVGSDPPGAAVCQDKAVTLTCQAAGLPAAVYTWAQVLDVNKPAATNSTLAGVLMGDKDQLVVANLAVYGGQDLKYICTARNTVVGQEYMATKEVIVRVCKLGW